MIVLSNEQSEKINLLDALFGAFGIEQLKEIAETEQVVAILKGDNNNSGILKKLVQEHITLSIEVSALKTDVLSLRNDMQTLVKIMNKPFESHHMSEFNSLKSKHNVY